MEVKGQHMETEHEHRADSGTGTGFLLVFQVIWKLVCLAAVGPILSAAGFNFTADGLNYFFFSRMCFDLFNCIFACLFPLL